MTSAYLYSGSDPTARDDLFTTVEDVTRDTWQGVVRAATKVVELLFHGGVGSDVALPIASVATDDVPLNADPILERIWTVDADGITPNARSRNVATELADLWARHDLEVDRVVADPEGGIALYAFAGARYVRLAAMNDGTRVALCADPKAADHRAWRVNEANVLESIRRARAFLAGE